MPRTFIRLPAIVLALALSLPSAALAEPDGPDPKLDGVTKTGATSYTLDKRVLEARLADATRFASEARAVPYYRDGAYRGVKLVGLRPDSLYRAIGLRGGDVIVRVNGAGVGKNRDVELALALKTAPYIQVELERGAEALTFGYTVR
jgi:membrane-associated protease RseP (regulator of RpoE activity)